MGFTQVSSAKPRPRPGPTKSHGKYKQRASSAAFYGSRNFRISEKPGGSSVLISHFTRGNGVRELLGTRYLCEERVRGASHPQHRDAAWLCAQCMWLPSPPTFLSANKDSCMKGTCLPGVPRPILSSRADGHSKHSRNVCFTSQKRDGGDRYP